MIIADLKAAIVTTTVLLSILVSSAASAQNINASVYLDSSEFRIGDPIVLTIDIDHPYGVSIEWPRNISLPDNFEMLSESPVDSISQNSFLTEKKVFTITTFDAGRIFTPEMKIFYHDKTGTLNNVTTNSIPINVSLAKVNLNDSFRSIAPPLQLPTSNITLYILGGGIILTLVSIVVVIIFKRKKGKRNGILEAPQPSEPVFTRLQNLEQELNQNKISVEHFYLKLTSLLREHIEQRFSFPAFEHTSREITRYIKKHIEDNELLEKITENFELADFVKFAKVIPSDDENRRVIQSAIDFVGKTSAENLPEEIGTSKTPTNAI